MAVSKPSTKKRTYDEMLSASAASKVRDSFDTSQKKLKIEQPVKRDVPAFLKSGGQSES